MHPTQARFTDPDASWFVREFVQYCHTIRVPFSSFLVRQKMVMAYMVDALELPYERRERLVALLRAVMEVQLLELRLLNLAALMTFVAAMLIGRDIIVGLVVWLHIVDRWLQTGALLAGAVVFYRAVLAVMMFSGRNASYYQALRMIRQLTEQPYAGNAAAFAEDLGVLEQVDPNAVQLFNRQLRRATPEP